MTWLPFYKSNPSLATECAAETSEPADEVTEHIRGWAARGFDDPRLSSPVEGEEEDVEEEEEAEIIIFDVGP